jgi:polysaccharide export outer membrane protein
MLALWCLLASYAIVALRGTAAAQQTASSESPTYVLGPGDELSIRSVDIDELDNRDAKPFTLDLAGDINLPLLGKVKAAGSTVTQLEAELARELKVYVREPQVAVTVVEYRSQPVSVLGSVNTPGVIPLTGSNTLEQVLSKAGGLRNDAGNMIYITRRVDLGTIPLPSDRMDPSGQFNTASVEVRDLLDAKNPQNNILIKPADVISVPKADLVYVMGSVRKPGGFVLNEKRDITVLQALSMAEGLETTSAPKRAKIIRRNPDGSRTEIAVNLSNLLNGKSQDVPLLGDDVLFVPNSSTKVIAYRGIEAAIQTGSGLAIFR